MAKCFQDKEVVELSSELAKQSLYDVLLDREVTDKIKEFSYYFLNTEGGRTGNF